MPSRFQCQRVGEVFGKFFVGQHPFQHGFTLWPLQRLEGRHKNFSRCFHCTHAVENIAYFQWNDKSEASIITKVE